MTTVNKQFAGKTIESVKNNAINMWELGLFEKRIKKLENEVSNYRKEIIDIQEMREL